VDQGLGNQDKPGSVVTVERLGSMTDLPPRAGGATTTTAEEPAGRRLDRRECPVIAMAPMWSSVRDPLRSNVMSVACAT
jgi:hypothetical protein